MTTPSDSPISYDKITLDKVPNPGICTRVSGGDRSWEIQDQAAPGFAGMFTVFRYEQIAKIEYRFEVGPEEYEALKAFASRLVDGNSRRPPKRYDFSDLYLEHNKVRSVSVESVGPIAQISGKQRWGLAVKLHEYKKRKPTGGPIAPGSDEKKQQEKITKDLIETGNALRSQLDAAQRQATRQGG